MPRPKSHNISESMNTDKAIRPLAVLPSGQKVCGSRLRHRQEQVEIARRVAIYAEQVERTGEFTWLPHREQGRSCED